MMSKYLNYFKRHIQCTLLYSWHLIQNFKNAFISFHTHISTEKHHETAELRIKSWIS